MASITGIAGIAIYMAGRAGYFTIVAMVYWKIMEAQISGRPRLDRMAILALQSKAFLVDFWFCMAGGTLAGCPREYTLLMAGCACD